jgi:hypothetical protein
MMVLGVVGIQTNKKYIPIPPDLFGNELTLLKYTKIGKVLPFSSNFVYKLPTVFLDGEFWYISTSSFIYIH